MTDDRNISVADVQTLATRDGVVAFFAALGYRTDSRQPQSVSAMGVTAGPLSRQIKHIERIAVHDDGAEPLDSYLIELTSVTIAATQGLARALRNRAGNYLLVLTDDYERLDFVLLQRSLPGAPGSPMAARQVSVRPRILTVNRRNPSQVQLRVLRRFTYTESDADAQYDKLLSAYAVAEWSEPLFNNRALFSDYYLNERLPELAEWRERPEEAYHSLRELLPRLRRHQTNTDEDGATFHPPMESALEALGFKPVKAAGGDEPDYRLYAPDNPGEAGRRVSGLLLEPVLGRQGRGPRCPNARREPRRPRRHRPRVGRSPVGRRHQRQAVASLLGENAFPVHQLLRDRPGRNLGHGRPQRGVPVFLALLPPERLRQQATSSETARPGS